MWNVWNNGVGLLLVLLSFFLYNFVIDLIRAQFGYLQVSVQIVERHWRKSRLNYLSAQISNSSLRGSVSCNYKMYHCFTGSGSNKIIRGIVYNLTIDPCVLDQKNMEKMQDTGPQDSQYSYSENIFVNQTTFLLGINCQVLPFQNVSSALHIWYYKFCFHESLPPEVLSTTEKWKG